MRDPVVRVLTAISVVLLGVIIMIIVTQNATRPAIADRLDRIESQFTYVSCLLLIPIEDRVERGIAECQFETDG